LPAKDKYHDTVIRALQKEGWEIISEQVRLSAARRRLWVDMQAEKSEQALVILIEVKGFEMPSLVDYLASAVGKYVVHTALLEVSGITTPLYMAVPLAAYQGILSENIGLLVRRKADLKLMVFDPVSEELVTWIH
jgi:hypothetical protein